jgi:hypothetical protein
MAIAHNTAPFYSIYKITAGDVFTKLPNNSVSLVSGNGTCARFSPDNSILYVGNTSNTFPLAIKHNMFISNDKLSAQIRLMTGPVANEYDAQEWHNTLYYNPLNDTINIGDTNMWNFANYSWAFTTPSSSSTSRDMMYGSTGSTNASSVASATRVFRPMLLIDVSTFTKYLIEKNQSIYAINPNYYGGTIPDNPTAIGVAPASVQDFIDYGADDLTVLNGKTALFNNLGDQGKVLIYKS